MLHLGCSGVRVGRHRSGLPDLWSRCCRVIVGWLSAGVRPRPVRLSGLLLNAWSAAGVQVRLSGDWRIRPAGVLIFLRRPPCVGRPYGNRLFGGRRRYIRTTRRACERSGRSGVIARWWTDGFLRRLPRFWPAMVTRRRWLDLISAWLPNLGFYRLRWFHLSEGVLLRSTCRWLTQINERLSGCRRLRTMAWFEWPTTCLLLNCFVPPH